MDEKKQNTDTNTDSSDSVTNTEAGSAPKTTPETTVAGTPVQDSAGPLATSEPVVMSNEPKSSALTQYLIAGAIILVMGVALLYMLEKQGRVSTGLFGAITNNQEAEGGPVATVNGVDISRAEYNTNRNQIIMSAQQQGIDTQEPGIMSEIDTQAVDVLVNTELLRQAARNSGIVVTDEEIEARYNEILEGVGGETVLAARMQELGLSEADLREDIEGEILVQNFLTSAVDVSGVVVTDEEIEAVYEQAGGVEAGLPPLAEVRAEIESQLRMSEEQQLVNQFIESLRAEADIQILI